MNMILAVQHIKLRHAEKTNLKAGLTGEEKTEIFQICLLLLLLSF